MIPRIIHSEVKFYSREYISRGGLDSFLGTSIGKEITRYTLKFYGILVQEEGYGELHLIGSGEKILFTKPLNNYCRWHNASLLEKDNPLERKYCLRKPVTGLGYCSEHKDSLRALYNHCFGSAGLDSMRSCWILDERLGEKLEYAVYLLAYSGSGFKVGSTRSWRIYHRIAEQPHVIATILYRSRSAVKTRDIEVKAGRIEGLTEKPHRTLRSALNTPIPSTINKLEKMRHKVAKVLGINDLGETVFRIEPGLDLSYYIRGRETIYEYLLDKVLELIDYYAGYLLVSELNTNTYYLVRINKILHTNALKTVS